MNKMKGNIKINIINAPTYGVSKKDMLSDLALLTKATIVNEDLGDDMDLIQPDFLGHCVKSITTDTETVIKVAEIEDSVKGIIENVKSEISNTKNTAEIQRLEKRLARLSAKIATVKVGEETSI